MTRICLLVAFLVAGILADEEARRGLYSSEFDNLDVEAILNDDAERDKYYACLMDTGPCHSEAAVFFKDLVPEVVVTSCKYCTPRQLEIFGKIVTWYIDNKSKEWKELVVKTIEDARKRGLLDY
uniref:Chemosensory protein 3 n=1 Tax=Encarsia formosa TaxID=32400 RepID=A0A6M5CHS4_ENCFO|nr:chemosensory protein 3 [Encarsia formosa]